MLTRKSWVSAMKTVMDMRCGSPLITRSVGAIVRPLMSWPPVLQSCMCSHGEQYDVLSSRRGIGVHMVSPSWNTDRGGESGREFHSRFYMDDPHEYHRNIVTRKLKCNVHYFTLPDPKGRELISTIVYPGKILDHGCSGTNVQIVRYMSDLGRKTHRTA